MESVLSNPVEVLSIGEILGDLIGSELSTSLQDTSSFNRFWGGSPVNFTSNLNKLGIGAKVVGCVGKENLGAYLLEQVKAAGLDTSLIKQHPSLPSSIVLVSRTTGTPDFIPYRMADCEIEFDDIPSELLEQVKILHTTCWPLSRNPSQATLLNIASKSKDLDIQLSVDLNYAQPVWPNLKEAQKVCKIFISNGAWVKLSEDDAERFLGEKLDPKDIIETFHKMGATLVVLTQGSQGSVISQEGIKAFFKPAENIDVKDATGAGDAYWAGFIASKLKGKTLKDCAESGSQMAKLKLQTVGPLAVDLDYSNII